MHSGTERVTEDAVCSRVRACQLLVYNFRPLLCPFEVRSAPYEKVDIVWRRCRPVHAGTKEIAGDAVDYAIVKQILCSVVHCCCGHLGLTFSV